MISRSRRGHPRKQPMRPTRSYCRELCRMRKSACRTILRCDIRWPSSNRCFCMLYKIWIDGHRCPWPHLNQPRHLARLIALIIPDQYLRQCQPHLEIVKSGMFYQAAPHHCFLTGIVAHVDVS
ncbi:hypothetical protein EVAR_6834_1 [Eumeta japonica]|uniref:Uncharacterized protein n=1 Tax=Eumeta variegata TaxID=151549 RepID=A0A4C1U669_EUMVA|nr:hypothetical protein EVAR_6834_1 [Eumeta japonica]